MPTSPPTSTNPFGNVSGLDAPPSTAAALNQAMQYAPSYLALKRTYKPRGRETYDENAPKAPKKGFKFGCDPEGFLFDKTTKEPVPAAGIIPGTKHEPFKVKKGAIQVDGMAVEFNIDPAETYEEWEGNITTVIKQLEKKLPKNLEIRWIPSVRFPEAAFDSAPDENKMLGCDPDFDAWSGAPNPPPMAADPYVRCAGGHLHIGFTENESLSDLQHLMNCQDLGKQMDWYLGGWSVYHDADNVRRSLYGKMGAIRYKPYGMEYRVLSNFWVPNQKLRLEVWNRMVTAVNCMALLFMPDRAGSKLTEYLKKAIDTHYIHEDLESVAYYPLLTLNPSNCRL